MDATTVRRFWSKVDKTETCWIWVGARQPTGYGNFWTGTKTIGAHVASYIIHYGVTPNGIRVLHTCDNAWCVNPQHLFAGTQADNLADMTAKGRRSKHNSKLTEGEVLAIRDAAKVMSLGQLAPLYGVSRSTIYRAVHHDTWW